MFLTGTKSYLRPEITRWMRPELAAGTVDPAESALAAIEEMMSSALSLAAASAYPGFALLYVGMRRHQHQIFGNRVMPPRCRTMLQAFGWLLLSASLLPAFRVSNVGVGLVAWTGALSIAAAPLTLGLAYAPCGWLAWPWPEFT